MIKELQKIKAGKHYTTNSYIEKIKSIYPKDLYILDNIEYTGSNGKIKVWCNTCSCEFLVTATRFLKGKGCPVCGHKQGGVKGRLNTEIFIEKASLKHNNFYNYTLSDYQMARIPVTIICPIHGKFEQMPYAHLHGVGCRKCGYEKNSKNTKLTQETVLQEFKLVHGDRYSYDKFVYITGLSKAIITCPIHGDFLQTARHHKKGSGCPTCANEFSGRWTKTQWINYCKSRNIQKAFCYIIEFTSITESFIKIGITTDVNRRIYGFKESEYNTNTIAAFCFDAGDIWDLEKYLHKKLKKHKHTPKIKFGGHTECFDSNILSKLTVNDFKIE